MLEDERYLPTVLLGEGTDDNHLIFKGVDYENEKEKGFYRPICAIENRGKNNSIDKRLAKYLLKYGNVIEITKFIIT